MGIARHFWSLLSSLGELLSIPEAHSVLTWECLPSYGDLGALAVGGPWLCLAAIFVHHTERSAALSRAQMEMLDSLCLSLLGEGKGLQVGFCP